VARVARGLVLKLGPMKAALALIGQVAGILENHLTELAKVMNGWDIVCCKLVGAPHILKRLKNVA